MSGALISIVIRAKNEQEWLPACLFAVSCQDWPSYEVVVVDNSSADRTAEIAEAYGGRVVRIASEPFNYSSALNTGIAASDGELVAILSAHCVPVHDQWLARLAMHFERDDVAAAYGRQEPLPDSSPSDKRDLWITFGRDRKLQRRDFFLHNANSMIRRSLWEELAFNERIHGVEDQDWARKIQRRGYRIAYEPTASVFHHHGIHHGGNAERVRRVAEAIELIQQGRS